MNVDRAFERRRRHAERLQRIEATGSAFLGGDSTPRVHGCPNALLGQHSTPNSAGRCAYCGHSLGRAVRPYVVAERGDGDEVADPVSLDTRDPADADEPPRTGRWVQTPTGRRRP